MVRFGASKSGISRLARMRKICTCAELLIGATLVLIILALHKSQSLIVAPDGTVIRFAGVTYGTNDFVYGSLFERTWGRVTKNLAFRIGGMRIHGPYVESQWDFPQAAHVYFCVEPKVGEKVALAWDR